MYIKVYNCRSKTIYYYDSRNLHKNKQKILSKLVYDQQLKSLSPHIIYFQDRVNTSWIQNKMYKMHTCNLKPTNMP